MSFGVIILIVLALLFIWAISSYNGLVALRNKYKNAYAQIDVQLKRRYDLIPNLVEAVKGYMTHEKGTLEAVIQARNQAASASQVAAAQPGEMQAMQQLSAAENQLTSSLGKMFALAESYPDLKASSNMAQLMEELSTTENKVSFARQGFNDAVMAYNTARESFPAVIIANNFGFQAAELLQSTSTEVERAAPKVSFS